MRGELSSSTGLGGFCPAEITLKASFINPYTQSRALRLIESGRIDVSSMVIERASVDELPTILADKRRRTAGKILITF